MNDRRELLPANFRTIVRPISLIGAALIVAAIAFIPAPAHAQFYSGFDPAGEVKTFATTNHWLSQAQTWAQHIYITLIVFEFFALGVTTLLFRENLGEFFASVGMKVVLGGIFFWFISVAGPSITQLPGAVMNTFGTTFGKGMGGTDSIGTITGEGFTAAGLFFSTSYVMRQADGTAAAIAEAIYPNCTITVAAGEGGGACYRQPSETLEFSRQVAELLTSGLAVMVGMAMATVYLQFTLITIESYLVMTAGTLFIGFSGSRFTMPFAQGYFSYMISVGVKLMALYLAVGLVGPLMISILVSATGALVGGILDPTGVAVLLAVCYGALSVVVGAGIIAMVPGFAASFITGQSFASGSAVLSQAMTTIAGSAQMMAQLGSANVLRKEAAHDKANARAVSADLAQQRMSADMSPAHARGAESFSPSASTRLASHATNTMGPTVLNDTLGMHRDTDANRAPQGVPQLDSVTRQRSATREGLADSQAQPVSASVESRNSDPTFANTNLSNPSTTFVNPQTGMPIMPGLANSNEATLNGLTDTDLRKMSSDEIMSRLPGTDWQNLHEDARQWLLSNNYGDAALAQYERGAESSDIQAELAESYGLSGLAQTGIRDNGAPAAVQVRLSTPDKL